VTADIKTIAAHDCYGLACITALTVQSTMGVKTVHPVPAVDIAATLMELAADFGIAAVHIGMLANADAARSVAAFLEETRPKHVVLDPVLRSSSGADLLDRDGRLVLRERLLPLADVITPNVDEAAALSGMSVGDLQEMKAAALHLHAAGAPAVVITGGHLAEAEDLLSIANQKPPRQVTFRSQHLESRSTHGTGCAFSCALACELALGKELEQAVARAKQYVTEAIRRAYEIGRGTGPVNHLFRIATGGESES
jgi:hydroxymethylpyrimidine/phosphomethylpyrimidine kinase